MCNESIRRLHEMVQHTKQDAKAGLAYMKWYEIESMCREEGREEERKERHLFTIKIIKNLVSRNESTEEISQLTELPYTLIEKVVEQFKLHPEWDNEQILEKIEK